MRIAWAAFAASALFALPAVAADQQAPPQLPPPPPPPSERSEGALDTRWALGAMLGVSTDYLNFGLGLRGGKTLDNHIYVGGSFLYHFAGDTFSGYSGALGNNVSSSASVVYFGPEGGYDIDLKAVVLRPYIGLGPAFFAWSVTGAGATTTGANTRFVVWPGATVIYDFPDTRFFIAGDIRFVSVPGGPAVGFFAFGGIHFGS